MKAIAIRRHPALRGYQARALQLLLRAIEEHPGETFTVMFPRQAGKNEVAAALVACLLCSCAESGGTVVICAPTLHPQGRISLERVERSLSHLAHLLPLGAAITTSAERVRAGRAEAVFLSASREANVAGHTASLALIADEAQDIDADWFNRQFRPMGASTGAPTVLFGTPWDGDSLLETAAAANRRRDARTRMGRSSGWVPFHQEVTWQEVARSRPAYGRYVRHERERLGADHPLFLSQYELVASEAAGRLLNNAQLAAIEGAHERRRAPVAGERYVAGLDFGGEGIHADASVLTIGRVVGQGRCEVVEHVAWQGQPFATVEAELAALAREWRFERACADATGIGASVVSHLMPSFGAGLEAVLFTLNVKSALGFGLVAAANTGRLMLYANDASPEARAVRAELRACRATRRPGGRMSWSDDRGHDDFAVSLALCLRAAEALGAPRVARGRARELQGP